MEQLDYVRLYFVGCKGKLNTVDDLYMAILWPAGIGKSDDYVLFDRDDKKHPIRALRRGGCMPGSGSAPACGSNSRRSRALGASTP